MENTCVCVGAGEKVIIIAENKGQEKDPYGE